MIEFSDKRFSAAMREGLVHVVFDGERKSLCGIRELEGCEDKKVRAFCINCLGEYSDRGGEFRINMEDAACRR